MRWIAVITALCGVLILMPGCGGGLSQEDMRRHAIRRSSNDASNDNTSSSARKVNPTTNSKPGVKPDSRANAATSAPPAIPGPPTPETAAGSVTATPESASSVAANPSTTPRPVPSSPPLSPVVRDTSKPLSVVERRQQSIDNLTRIGDAIRRYCDTNGRFFGRAICDPKGQPLLSWRVELLPYLGHQALYDQFDLAQPWDSANNLPLTRLIPEVYQSPERFDERTNYLLPVASFTPFGSLRGLGLRQIEDKVENTVVLLEADDAAAVSWTQPEDLRINLRTFDAQVGKLRGDGFFAVWGDGSVTRVAAEHSAIDLKAILSFDGGDAFTSRVVRATADATPTQIDAEGDEGAVELAAERTEGARAERTHQPAAVERGASTKGQQVRVPVPDSQSLERARGLVREIYQNAYKEAKTAPAQQALAQLMLKNVAEMSDDQSGQYVVLDIVMQVSTQIGDSSTALSAAEQMLTRFEIDELQLKHDLLQQLAQGKNRGAAVHQTLRDEASALIEMALRAEDFDAAESLCQIASRAARNLDDNREATRLETQRKQVEATRQAYRTMHRTIAALKDADDPKANLEVGRYYCLIRGDWERGLPLLAKGDDAKLKELAQAELRAPSQPSEQVELADGWWELNSEDGPSKKVLHLHAAYWYLRAAPRLPQGLLKVKAELRVKHVEREYGREALAALDPARAHR